MSLVHTFAGNPLNRGHALRRDAAWLDAAARAPATRYLPLHQLNVLVDALGSGPHLGWLKYHDIGRLEVDVPPVFLGLDENGVACFAQDISAVHDPHDALNLPAALSF